MEWRLEFSPEPMARRSTRRPWITIGIWVVALIIGLGLRGAVFESTISTEFDFTSTPDSKKADNLIEERLRGPIGTNEVILLQSDSLTVDDPAYEPVPKAMLRPAWVNDAHHTG